MITRRVVSGWKDIARLQARNFCDASQNVLYEQHNKVVTIGINRPEKRNAVNRQTAVELSAAFKRFDNSEKALVAVLYGCGGSFCAGYDLEEVSNTDKAKTKEDFETTFRETDGPMGGTHLTLKKPVIAAVSGFAVAGGLELALFCAMRIVEEDAIFGVLCRKHGVPLIDGGTVRLPKLIGLSRALDMILTGREVKAEEAFQFGLANRVVPTGQALHTALEIANHIAKFPQLCMRSDMASAYHSTYNATSLDDALAYEFTNGLNVIQAESVAGAKKFVQRERIP